jgi:hypothetical protein
MWSARQQRCRRDRDGFGGQLRSDQHTARLPTARRVPDHGGAAHVAPLPRTEPTACGLRRAVADPGVVRVRDGRRCPGTAIVKATYPILRAVEAMGCSFPSTVLIFARIYLWNALNDPAAFTRLLDHNDSPVLHRHGLCHRRVRRHRRANQHHEAVGEDPDAGPADISRRAGHPDPLDPGRPRFPGEPAGSPR